MTAADVWWELGDSYQARQAAVVAVRCPHCNAVPGELCRTPNGWAAQHKARIAAAAGHPPTVKPHRFRLSDPQAQRLEWAAENGGVLYAPGQYALLGGDAANRACADALLRAGLVEEVVASVGSSERTLRLTAEGWRVWCTHRLVIRRFPDGQHPAECWCRRDEETNR